MKSNSDDAVRSGPTDIRGFLYPGLYSLAVDNLARKDWLGFLYRCEKRFRLRAFQYIEPQLSDPEYWPLLSKTWISVESIHEHIPVWVSLLSSPRHQRQLFMSNEDRAVLKQMPEVITIYRGYQPSVNCRGLSWTLSRAVAELMSHRVVVPGDLKLISPTGRVRQKKIQKSEAFAYLNERHEQEIIFLGEYRRN